MQDSVSYFSLLDPRSSGVKNKIFSMTRALAKIYELEASVNTFDPGLGSVCALLYRLAKCKSKIIVLRSSITLSPFYFPILLYKRLVGSKIIIDVPTPRDVVFREVYNSELNFFNKSIKLILLCMFSNLQLYPANIVLFNGKESRVFRFFLNRKIVYFFNGIDIERYDSVVRSRSSIARANSVSNEINLIGVGQLANWHGFDRVIKAIGLMDASQRKRFVFNIVGTGDEERVLKKLVRDLELDEYIKFVGKKEGDELNHYLVQADLGVASLGLHRIGMKYASTLKQREYCASGLPMIVSTYDPDFPECSFCLTVEEGEECDSIKSRLLEFNPVEFCSLSIRDYSDKHLSYESKVRRLIFSRMKIV